MAKKQQSWGPDEASPFAKGRLKRLRQEDGTWEADFRALPKPMMQSETHYLGIVVTKKGGAVLAKTQVEGRPTVNDLAILLAQAIRQPLTGKAHRPNRLQLRGHRQWQELFPHLEEIGIEVAVRKDLPKVEGAYKERLRQEREASRATMIKPSPEQAAVVGLFPTVAKWVRGYGHIEIGDQEIFGFVAQALSHGNMVFEDDRPETLAEALAALEKGLAEYFEREGIE